MRNKITRTDSLCERASANVGRECAQVEVARSLSALHGAELGEGVALGDDELAVLVRDVPLDVARVDQVGEHALDLVQGWGQG